MKYLIFLDDTRQRGVRGEPEQAEDGRGRGGEHRWRSCVHAARAAAWRGDGSHAARVLPADEGLAGAAEQGGVAHY